MNNQEFREQAHKMVDWMADYLENIRDFPVKSTVQPKEIYKELPENPPITGESMDVIFNDFQKTILKGITHWQHPNFHAYFPANSSYPSLLAEMLMSTLGAQCMVWDTSPAAAELEERVMNWLGDMIGIPTDWHGVIQDTASTATLAAILTARERYSNFNINENGFVNAADCRIYCSSETHSSIEKGVKIAGFGKNSLIKVATDDQLRLSPDALQAAIEKDIAQGKKPICIVVAIGTTGTTAIDPLAPIVEIAQKYNIWVHIDAAYAGTALVLPEFRWMIKGIEKADSFVFNPHKWMFTNFDCTAYYVKDRQTLVNTFAIMPEYLKTQQDEVVNNYRDWGIPLGRRFRALKLWFVIRHFGVAGIQEKIRKHIALAEWFEAQIVASEKFEIVAPRTMNAVFFRYKPPHETDETAINAKNEQLLQALNATGKVYLTHTKVHGKYTLRAVIAQTNVEKADVELMWNLVIMCNV